MEDDARSDRPRVLKLSRRVLGRTLAVAAAGTLAARSASAEQKTARQETTLDRFSLFTEARAFKHPVAELFVQTSGSDPRLVATSRDGWLAIWPLGTPDRPRFKGQRRTPGAVRLVRASHPFRQPVGEPSAVAEDGNSIATYERKQRLVRVERRDGRVIPVQLPPDRGLATVLGLGGDGSALAVAMEMGGILAFDLRGPEAAFVGEFHDSNIAQLHVCAEDQDRSRWAALPCVCDLVQASAPDRKGATISTYDKLTGNVSTATLPCGSPIPAGAVCVCNCVSVPIHTVTTTICTCNLVCTCDTVSTGTTYTYTYWYPN